MRLVARTEQVVRIAGLDDLAVHFSPGEWLRTEISAKFTATRVRDELWDAGLVVDDQWTDPRRRLPPHPVAPVLLRSSVAGRRVRPHGGASDPYI